MKILSAKQTQLADAYTIEHEPISSIDLMERASIKFVEVFVRLAPSIETMAIVCGTGNNGGDGLAIARLLRVKGYILKVFVIQPKKGGSADFLQNLERLGKEEVTFIRDEADLADFENFNLIIDGVFGSGLTRPVTGLHAQVINRINSSGTTVYAIDMPSGLYMDVPATAEGAIIQAQHTISFQQPKLAFFFPENYKYVGDWHVVDIGLDKKFTKQLQSIYSSIDKQDIRMMLKPRDKFAHKGRFGHAQLVGGSYGKMGAIILATEACLRSGGGLVTVTIPESGVEIMQTSVPEAMVLEQPGARFITGFNVLEKAEVVGIGPGLGTSNETATAFSLFLRSNNKPLIIDADAINILSKNRGLIELLPQETILTPHIKEFDRLAGNSKNNWERLEKAIELCRRLQLVIVLKGAHTAVIDADGKVSFNTNGNPGMATAGSGDVLLGVITGLRAQGLNATNSARAGVFIHGYAGDLKATEKSEAALIAGDLIDGFSQVFLDFQR